MWIPLDVYFFEEYLDLSDTAQLDYVEMLCWCKRLGTDGRLSMSQFRYIAERRLPGSSASVCDELCESQLCVCDGPAIIVRSWERWHESAAAISQRASVKQTAGALGNHNRWHVARSVTDSSCRYCDESASRTPVATAMPSRIAKSRVEKSREEELTTSAPSALDDPLRGFDKFWTAYPARNGKRLGKTKAADRWRPLDLEQRRAAYRGARNYALACDGDLTIAKDAERWLRDHCWTDWQEPAVAASRLNGHATPNAVVVRETADPTSFVSAAQSAPMPADLKALLPNRSADV